MPTELQEELAGDRLTPLFEEMVAQAVERWGGEYTVEEIVAGLKAEDADGSPGFGPMRVLLALANLEARGRLARRGIGFGKWRATNAN